jgi:hypothetical protein
VIRLVLDEPSLGWEIYTLASFGFVFVVVLFAVLFVIPDLVRESWAWIHDALRPVPQPDPPPRQALDRARMELVVSLSERKRSRS